jgi:DNA/RNA endonuclease G (NUC1)/uncharacterized protein YjdB
MPSNPTSQRRSMNRAWLLAAMPALLFLACVSADRITAPLSPGRASFDLSKGGGVVISQVYGGGGNSGATLTNDFIELHNTGASTVPLTGWSVQYASAAGSSWTPTTLSGSIAPGGYYLIQESKGAGGTTALPTPDATGGILMSASASKVALVNSTTALVGACPSSDASVVDLVGVGGTATCFEGSAPTAGTANATAAIRKDNGNQDTNDNAADFGVATAIPRNSSSPTSGGGGGPVTGPLDHVTITGGADVLQPGGTTQFTAAAFDAANLPVPAATITWSSSDPAVASVDNSGKVTAVTASTTPVILTATAVAAGVTKTATATLTVTAPPPAAAIVISQVYGGGGNSGATLKNDFIELFNTTNNPVTLDGWSVQYGSATTSTWTATPLAGVIQPGGYFLVQEAKGNGGTDTLPTADVIGTLALGAASGKVVLVRSTAALTVACPTDNPLLADLVGFGGANCAEGNDATPALSNTTAALRKGNGTVDSDDNAADFDVGAPSARNSASPRAAIAGPLDHVTITGGAATLAAGTTTDFDAAPQDAANVFIGSAKITWTSSNPAVATVDKNGVVNGLVPSATPVTLSVTAVANGITRTATATFTVVVPPPVATIIVTPSEWSLKVGETKQFTAAPFGADGRPTVTTFNWTSSDNTIATVNATTGLVTGKGIGLADITVTSADGKTSTVILTVNSSSNVVLSSGKNSFALGMQTQFFYGGTDASGAPITSVVWSTATPSIATVDQHGIVTGKSLGSTQLIATAPDGSVGTTGIKIYLAAGSSGVRLGHNTEFGEPQDADPSDDFLIRRAQYTVSYNATRGGANWVSWNLDKTHIGDNGRCAGTCYSADTALTNAGITAYTTADWVTGNTYDRGHMAPSADWTSSEADNNTTFFLSNFVPQTHDMNAGPWEKLENALRDSVSGGREAYIIAGGNFGPDGRGLGTILGLGRIAIPVSTWKIAVITPAGTGINADGSLPPNSTVMAVDMPNVYGILGDGFEKYLTTIDRIQQETGYDFLALLAESTECRVEVRNCAPRDVAFSGATILAGETYAATGSFTDPDADSWSGTVDYGDGTSQPLTISGKSFQLSHRYTSAGSMTVTVSVSDQHGGTSSGTAVVTVESASDGVAHLSGLLAGLPGNLNSLQSKLDNADKQLGNGKSAPAANMLEAFVNELQAMINSGRVSDAQCAPIIAYAQRVIASARS